MASGCARGASPTTPARPMILGCPPDDPPKTAAVRSRVRPLSRLASGPSREGACRHPRGAAWSASPLRRVVASWRPRADAAWKNAAAAALRGLPVVSLSPRAHASPTNQIEIGSETDAARRVEENASHAPPLPPPTPCATVPSIDVRCRGPRRAASILQRRKCPAAAAAAETASAGLSVPHRLG